MPLVRLTGDYPQTVLAETAKAVHEAMVACLGVPADDIFRVTSAVSEIEITADARYLGIDRRRPLFVEITLRKGRTDDAKRSFYRAVADTVDRAGDVRPSDILITLRENEAIDWSFGDGIAQGAPGVSLLRS